VTPISTRSYAFLAGQTSAPQGTVQIVSHASPKLRALQTIVARNAFYRTSFAEIVVSGDISGCPYTESRFVCSSFQKFPLVILWLLEMERDNVSRDVAELYWPESTAEPRKHVL
jgi:hypothetical protein